MTRIQNVGFVVAGLVLGGGLVSANGTSPPPVIHACANNETGALRLGNRCYSATETAITWNQQGVQGERGPSSARAITYDGPPEASWIQSPSICGPGGQYPLTYIEATNYHCYWHTAFLGNLGPGDHMITAKLLLTDPNGGWQFSCDLHVGPYLNNPAILDHTIVPWSSHDTLVETPITFLGSLSNSTFTPKPLYVTCRGLTEFEVTDLEAHVVHVDEVTEVSLP